MEALTAAAGAEAGTAGDPGDVGDVDATDVEANGAGNVNAATGSGSGPGTGADSDQSPPPFLVNYNSESDFYSGPPSPSQQSPPSAPKDANSSPFADYAIAPLGFDSSRKGLTSPNQQYFFK